MFALLPPSQHNLGAYVSWASSARQAGVFLAEHTEHCVKVVVPAGASFFIPVLPLIEQLPPATANGRRKGSAVVLSI